MFNNPYMNSYNPQMTIDKINEQMNELNRMKQQLQQPQQPTNLTQNFQIAPTNREVIRYANSMEEVQRDMVIGDTPYFSKDMSVVWIKNTKGDIKTYELTEIIAKDDKDIQIEMLQAQINEMKGMISNAKSNDEMMNLLMNQLRARNPQMFNMIDQARKNNNNPEELFKEITKNYKPEQMEQIFNKAKQFGIGDDIINKLK